MLLGRLLECARLERLIAATAAGSGDVLLLRGVPGSGKSALLEFAVARAERLMVLRAAGVPGETELAFGGILELLQPIAGDLPKLPAPQRDALSGALGVAPAVERDRFLIGAATLRLLLHAGQRQPVLVAVDDAHWLDSPSLETLLFAARRLPSAPIGMVMCARADPLAVLDQSGLEELPVRPLDPDSTEQLAHRLAGAPVTGRADEIFRRTQGLPLAITELGRLGDPDDGLGAPVPISTQVEQAYARDFQEAPDDVRAWLLLAAADDTGNLATVLAAAERLGIPPHAQDGAEELRLIEVAAGRLRFRHPLVRSAVYQAAAAPERRRTHGALADTLDDDRHADRRAWHRAAAVAAPDEAVAAELVAMGARARARSGYAVAARALDRAARLTPAPEAAAARAIAAADAYWNAGEPTQAERLLSGALDDATDPLLRADAEHLLGRLLHFRGEPAHARELLVGAARRVEQRDRAPAADIIATALHAALFSDDARVIFETATETIRIAGGVASDPRVCTMTGTALTVHGRLDDAEPYFRRAIESAAKASGDPFVLVYAVNSHGWLCEYRAAAALAARLLTAAQELGAPSSVAWARMLLVEYSCALGNFDAATDEIARILELAEETGQAQVMAWTRYHAALLAANRGPDADVRAHLERAREQRVPLSFMGLDASASVLGIAALARGDADAALRALEPIDLQLCQANYAPWTSGADLVEGYARAGEHARATATLDKLRPGARQAWARAALARAEGCLVDDDSFDAPLQRAAAGFARLGVRLEEARTRLCHGERLRRAGRRVEARAQLRAACESFEAMGCGPWIARAEAELRASGETLRPRGPGPAADDLTPQELHVATLVCEGLSNKEAAARLFLSVKTIEAHLHRVYRKLGVRSRAELAPLLRERAEHVR